MVVVTHSQRVAAHCDRVVRLEYGAIAQDSGGGGRIAQKEKPAKGFSSIRLGLARSFATAYSNIRKNRLRNILVSLGTGIGIFSVVVLLFLSRGIGNYVTDQMYSHTNPLLVEVSKQSGSEGAGRRFAAFLRLEPFSEDEINRLAEIAGVESVELGGVITGSTVLSLGNKAENIVMLSTLNSGFFPDIKAGKMPDSGQILVSESVANAFGGSAALVGKEIVLRIDTGDSGVKEKSYIVSGVIENNGGPASWVKAVYLHFSDLASLGDWMPINMLYLTAASWSDVVFIKAEVARQGFNLSSRESALNRILSFIDTVTVGLTGVAAVSLVVSGIMILVVLFISVVERTREIGILRAIGARVADIRRIFVCEGVLLGLGSGIIGILLAVAVSGMANRILTMLVGARLIAINLPNVFTGIFISVSISMLASLIPASKASRLDPVESLRHE